MSVLIKGMEMPRHCGECGIDWCHIWHRAENPIEKRPPDCPLVEVPTPHGRLIDADKLCLSSGFSTATEYGMGRSDQIEAIKSNAPTIIPASGGAEDDR